VVEREAVEVLAFWFGEITGPQRFARDDAVDAAIRERFGALHAKLAAEVPASWRVDPASTLAAVIVLDQFSRNLHRGSAKAFAQDPAALALARAAIARGDDAMLQPEERHFLYMPLMHSESLADQDDCVRLIEGLGMAEPLDFAKRHRDIIARFGRFPHRNAALGRETTPEEAEFLKEPGSSF
jgi:uncharacterized protein (DUF924 family)